MFSLSFQILVIWIISLFSSVQFSSVQSLSHVRLFVTPWIAARQASLSITNSRSSLRLTSIKSVMPSSHLILGRPLLLLPTIPPSIRVFSKKSTLRMRWPKYWSFSFSIIPPKKSQGWSPSECTGWISLQSKGLSRVFSNTTVQRIKKERDHFADKSSHSQCYGFSSSHVWLWELDHKEGWVLKNWCFWIVVLEKTLESPLDSKEMKPVNPKGNQLWIFIGRDWCWSSNTLTIWWGKPAL